MYIQFLKEENRFYAFQEIMKSLKLKRHRIGIRYEENRHRTMGIMCVFCFIFVVSIVLVCLCV